MSNWEAYGLVSVVVCKVVIGGNRGCGCSRSRLLGALHSVGSVWDQISNISNIKYMSLSD